MPDKSLLIVDYPRVIDPAVSVIELQPGECGPGETRVTHLYRLDPRSVHHAAAAHMAIPNRLAHFFAPAHDYGIGNPILAYDTSGFLAAVIRTGTTPELHEVGCEGSGAPPLHPSLRLVFKDERGRDVFLHYLNQVRSGKYQNASVAMALDGLAEDIRVIDVAILQAG